MAESKTLGELGTGTVNSFLVGLLKWERLPSDPYSSWFVFKREDNNHLCEIWTCAYIAYILHQHTLPYPRCITQTCGSPHSILNHSLPHSRRGRLLYLQSNIFIIPHYLAPHSILNYSLPITSSFKKYRRERRFHSWMPLSCSLISSTSL